MPISFRRKYLKNWAGLALTYNFWGSQKQKSKIDYDYDISKYVLLLGLYWIIIVSRIFGIGTNIHQGKKNVS